MNYQKYYSNQIHSSSLLCQLAQMWRTQMLCDAVIKTGNVTTKAHRLVLVAACPMLQSMDNASIGSHLEVRLASEIKQDSINMFLQYLYEGFMLLTEENARDIEKIARLLQVDSVIKCCADFNKSLHEKTGLPVYSPAQYKYTFHDMLEFKHVRVSGIQKSMLEGAMKRNASEFSRPGSPGGKRQRMHRPGSPSLEGASHRADDTQSMSDSYRSSHQPAEPWDRVPRLGSGMSRGRNIQPGVIEIIEDSLELVQTEPVEKDPVTGRPIESRQPAQKSVAISVASQVTGSDPDLQIINVTGGGGGEGGSHSQPASTSTTSTSSSRGNRTVSDPSQSSSASGRGGDMQSSPRISSSERSFMMAGPSPRTDHQRHLQVQHQQFQNEQQRIQQQNAFGGFGQIELEAVSHIPGLTKPKPPESHHSIPQKNQFSHGPPVLQSKPFAAGSAHQVTAQSSAAPPSSQGSSSSVVSQISIPPISPVTSESSPFSGSMASPGSKNRNVPTSSSRTDSIERPSSVERPKDTSSKPKSGPSTPVTDESTPDISIVKVESTEKVIDTITGELSDTGGLDMFVDTHGDEGMPPQVLDDDNDQTYEGSDYDVEEPPGEGSNEGSNLSGDQNSSWYLNTMKGTEHTSGKPDTFMNEKISVCSDVNTDKEMVKSHMYGPKQIAFCVVCILRFSCVEDFVQHQRECHTEYVAVCKDCGKGSEVPTVNIVESSVPQGQQVSAMYQEEQTSFLSSHLCRDCSVVLPDQEAFAKHLTITHGVPYVGFCKYCGKCFKSSGGLSLHQRLHLSSKSSARCAACPTCGKVFQTQTHLVRHQKSHSNEKPFICLTCGKNYKHKDGLNSHNCRK